MNDEEEFKIILKRLFKKSILGKPVRLIGICLNDLSSKNQATLFETNEFKKRHQLVQSLDRLREKYGLGVI